jgi:hypothetical protein
LFHGAVISIAVYLGVDQRFGGIAAYLFVLLLCLASATAIFGGIERPLMRLRDVFRGRRPHE